MRFDYGTQISPTAITLSIGTLRKPKLKEICELTFDKFTFYEFLAKMTPEIYYTQLNEKNGGKEYWESFTEEQQNDITLYSLILEDDFLSNIYVEMLNFFFVEKVVFAEGYFIVFKNDTKELDNIEELDDIDTNNVRSVISDKLFSQVLISIQQICCIYDEKDDIDDAKYKNDLARKLMERMKKEAKQNKKKSDINLTLPNIISSVSNKHPSLNYINIWELTIFQLMDAFNRLQRNTMYDIDSTRVSVWGDEKKTFDVSLWYKNEYDKKKST